MRIEAAFKDGEFIDKPIRGWPYLVYTPLFWVCGGCLLQEGGGAGGVDGSIVFRNVITIRTFILANLCKKPGLHARMPQSLESLFTSKAGANAA